MKFKILQLLITVGKYSYYGLVLQVLFLGVLLADDIKAQETVSVREVSISIQGGETGIREIFSVIEAKTHYRFAYDKKNIDSGLKVNLKQGIHTVGNILLKLSEVGGLHFRQINRVINVDAIEASGRDAERLEVIINDVKITGRVSDENDEPLPGVYIIVKGTNRGVASDANGNFSLMVSEGESLLIRHIGYKTQEIIVNSQSVINVTMTPDLSTLDEVIVVGYGTVRKRDLTGSVATVRSKELEPINTTSLDKALAGQAPGVFVRQLSGAPGAGATVNIRGMSSIKGDNQPLYVIDGVPIEVNPNFGELSPGSELPRENPLLAISPGDIENIDILKDASASAIYGARAANGVIIVTTKRGKRNQQPKIDFNYTYSSQNALDTYDVLSIDQYQEYATIAAPLALDNLRAQGIPDFILPIYAPDDFTLVNDPDNFFGDANTDWQKEILRDNAPIHEYGLGINGGTEKLAYSFYGNSRDQTGVIEGSGLKRYGIRGTLDADILDKLIFGNSISYNYTKTKSSEASALGQFAIFRPDIPIYDQNGNYTTVPFRGLERPNPIGDVQGVSTGTSKNLLTSTYLELEVTEGLKFHSTINIGILNNNIETFSPDYTTRALINAGNGGEIKAILETSEITTTNTTFDNTLTYDATLNNKHTINAVAGISWNNNIIELKRTTFAGFPDNEVLIDQGSASEVTEFDSDKIESGLNSFFARINYIFDNKYLFTFTGRSDASTKFGPDNRRGFFPSAAIAWRIHNEPFMKGLSFIDNLKVRASAGRTGTDNLANFVYLTYFGSESFSSYENLNGIVPTDVPNPGIGWEKTDQIDLGLEFGLFDYRLTGEIVYFSKYTKDLLLYAPVPFETGSISQFQNVAEMSNKGWEIELGSDIIRYNNFQWNSSLNISFIENRIEKLNNGTPFNGFGSNGVIEGHPLGTSFGYRVDHIFQKQEEIDALNAASPSGFYQSSDTAPGDYMFVDLDGDGAITSEDRDVLGSIQPDFFGGWKNTLTYKGFDLFFLFQFTKGSTKEWTFGRQQILLDGAGNNKLVEGYTDRWSEANPNAKYPRIAGSQLNSQPSDAFIVESSFIRLKAVRLTYTFPASLLHKLPVRNARIFISGNNLWTKSDYPGLDPESLGSLRNGTTLDQNRDTGNYPFTKIYSVGIGIGL